MALRRASEAERREVRSALETALRSPSTAARDLFRRLRGRSAEEILAILDREIERFADGVTADLEVAVDAAAARGVRAASKALAMRVRASGATVPTRVVDRLAIAARRWTERRSERGGLRVSPLSGTRTAAVFESGDTWLSKALHGTTGTPSRVQQLGRVLAQGVRAGETADSLARVLRDQVRYRPSITDDGPGGFRIPRVLREYEEASRQAIRATGSPRAGQIWARTRAEFQAHAEALQRVESQSAASTALKRIEAAVRRGREAAVDDAVEWYIWDREQIHMRLVVEDQTTRAFNAAFVEEARSRPWIVGLEWEAEPGACEVCRDIASGHSSGMPAGCYRWGEHRVPPAHPRCRCIVFEVMDDDLVDDEPGEA